MIRVKVVDVGVSLLGELKLEELTKAVNEIGEERILYVTSAAKNSGHVFPLVYTIFYRDDD